MTSQQAFDKMCLNMMRMRKRAGDDANGCAYRVGGVRSGRRCAVGGLIDDDLC
jgi:hypothetical protein